VVAVKSNTETYKYDEKATTKNKKKQRASVGYMLTEQYNAVKKLLKTGKCCCSLALKCLFFVYK